MRVKRVYERESDHRTCSTTQSFNKGRIYWEIVIESVEGAGSNLIYVGICKVQEATTLGEIKDTYGILVPETKKFYRLPKASQYKM